MSWPLPEVVVVAWLREQLDTTAVAVSTPGNLESLDFFHRVSAGPGADDFVTDSAGIDIETFAPTRLAAAREAEVVRQAMHALTGRVAGGALVDRVRTTNRPTYLNYQNPTVARYVHTYVIETRQTAAP